jgi:YihY family inner membrane protein
VTPEVSQTPATRQRFALLLRRWGQIRPTILYWMETEVHVYGFSIAANVLLSFFPFIVVLISICQYLLHWPQGVNAIFTAVSEYFPGELGGFLKRNLQAAVWQQSGVQAFSLLVLLFTANGVFEPMEVALNSAWGVHKHRNFLANQVISLFLIGVCGVLAMASITLTALSFQFVDPGSGVGRFVGSLTLKLAAVPMSILALLLVYWLLPNRKILVVQVLPAAVIVGVTLEVFKYVFLAIYPWLLGKLEHEYGPFKHSITILLVSFVVSMIVLAGAEASARIERTMLEQVGIRTEPAAH